jgi:hypothetical protein
MEDLSTSSKEIPQEELKPAKEEKKVDDAQTPTPAENPITSEIEESLKKEKEKKRKRGPNKKNKNKEKGE